MTYNVFGGTLNPTLLLYCYKISSFYLILDICYLFIVIIVINLLLSIH